MLNARDPRHHRAWIKKSDTGHIKDSNNNPASSTALELPQETPRRTTISRCL